MNIYGTIALDAGAHCHKWGADPTKAWDVAAQANCPHSVSTQRKSGPRSTFTDLCAARLVRGIPHDFPTRASVNQALAVKAVELLRADKSLATNRQELWRRVLKSQRPVTHNGQLGVVLALWEHKMLRGQK